METGLLVVVLVAVFGVVLLVGLRFAERRGSARGAGDAAFPTDGGDAGGRKSWFDADADAGDGGGGD